MTTPTTPLATAALVTRNGGLWILVPSNEDGEVLVVNDTGYGIVQQCNGTRTRAEIVATLAAQSGAPVDKVTLDVTSFMDRLRQAGMLAD